MKVDPECYPCLLGRALSIARRITDDPWLQHRVIGASIDELGSVDRDATPAEAICSICQRVGKTLGDHDPFLAERERWNGEIRDVLPEFRAKVDADEDPLRAAVSITSFANVFDDERLPAGSVRDVLEAARQSPGTQSPDSGATLVASDYTLFAKDVDAASNIVFLHDSGPEVAFDALVVSTLVRRVPGLKVTSVVRPEPILLDALAADVETWDLASLTPNYEVVVLSKKELGVPAGECGSAVQAALDGADLIFAKGQAHAETLAADDKRIYLSMRVKCPVMARHQGVKVGDALFVRASA